MSNYMTYDGTLYDYTAGTYCGVLITEKVMKKLAAMQAKHLEDVKRLLTDEAENGNVFPSMWTLHYPKGKQTHVQFIELGENVKQRIKNATTRSQPVAHKTVFIASSMGEAEKMADARFAELNPEVAA